MVCMRCRPTVLLFIVLKFGSFIVHPIANKNANGLNILIHLSFACRRVVMQRIYKSEIIFGRTRKTLFFLNRRLCMTNK